MRALLIFMTFCCLGCALDGKPYDPNRTANPDNNSPPTFPGGDLGPPPSGAPPNSLATTSGGYITFKSIVEGSVDLSESLIGAATMNGRVIVLLERSPTYGMYVWDVFELTSAGRFQMNCSIPRPPSSTGAFLGMTYDGSQLVVLNYAYTTGLILYSLDPDLCRTAFVRTLFATTQYYYGSSVAFAYYGGKYITDTSGLVSIDPGTFLVTPIQFATSYISGYQPAPNNRTFAVGPDGKVWFVSSQSMGVLWMGGMNGSWKGWTRLPYDTYSDLTLIRSVLAVSPSDLRILTWGRVGQVNRLRIYNLNVTHFSP